MDPLIERAKRSINDEIVSLQKAHASAEAPERRTSIEADEILKTIVTDAAAINNLLKPPIQAPIK